MSWRNWITECTLLITLSKWTVAQICFALVKKQISGWIWNLQWGWGLHVEKKISVCFLYPEICFLMKVSFITSVPVEFCGMLPATLGPKSVHLLIPTTILNHRTERGRMTVNAVHSKRQVGDYELESESVDLVASVLKIMSVVVHHHVPLPASPKKPISWGHCRRQPYGKIQHRKREGLGPDSSKFAWWRES